MSGPYDLTHSHMMERLGNYASMQSHRKVWKARHHAMHYGMTSVRLLAGIKDFEGVLDTIEAQAVQREGFLTSFGAMVHEAYMMLPRRDIPRGRRLP